jgi:hypothetical protein
VSKVVVLVPPGQADVYHLPESVKPLNEVVFVNRTSAAVHTLFQSPAVRLVIMSGWVHDMHLALYYGKPLLLVSYTREQIEMSDVVNSLGLGAAVSSSTVKEQPFELFRTVNTVLETSSYGEMAQWMSKLLRSAPGVEGSVREILNHYELEILDPGPDLSIPWYKTTCIDVYAVYALLLCGVAIIVKTLWMALKNILIRTTEHLEEQQQQQQLHHHHQQHPQHNRDIFNKIGVLEKRTRETRLEEATRSVVLRELVTALRALVENRRSFIRRTQLHGVEIHFWVATLGARFLHLLLFAENFVKHKPA